jgi:tetratricopeptide (TPR) repeat protein
MGLEAAREARRRDPADFRRAWRVGQMLWYHAYPDALRFSPEARIEVTRIAQLKQRAKQTGQVQAMHMLGAIHYARGEWDSALQWWIKAAGNRPGSVQARLNQASAAWLADRREDARGTWSMLQPRRWPEGCLEALRAARDRNPTGARQWLDQAELASQCGDIERTDRWIGRALELNEAIDPASVYRFDAADLARAEMLRVRARVLAKNRPEADQAPAVIDP